MNYNRFTISYIEAIKRNLNIEINTNGEAVFIPDNISSNEIEALQKELTSIWVDSQSAIEVVMHKIESTVQSGLFGLIDDFDKALKVGFLIGDRVVLIDFLFDRILSKKPSGRIDKEQLGLIGNNIAQLLPLAKQGRIVIIPNPFSWNENTKQIMKEVSEKHPITPHLMSMLNMLSICKTCRLHPYTIAESESLYEKIIDEQIDHVDAIGRDGGRYAYEGLLGALLTEKILNAVEFSYIKNIPISNFIEIIAHQEGFYLEYLKTITSGGSLNGDNSIEAIKTSFLNQTRSNCSIICKKMTNGMRDAGAIGSGAVSLLSAFSIASAPVAVAGGVLGLISATLSALISDKSHGEDIILNVFHNLKKSLEL